MIHDLFDSYIPVSEYMGLSRLCANGRMITGEWNENDDTYKVIFYAYIDEIQHSRDEISNITWNMITVSDNNAYL